MKSSIALSLLVTQMQDACSVIISVIFKPLAEQASNIKTEEDEKEFLLKMKSITSNPFNAISDASSQLSSEYKEFMDNPIVVKQMEKLVDKLRNRLDDYEETVEELAEELTDKLGASDDTKSKNDFDNFPNDKKKNLQ
jgi:hypothetical protein